MFPDQFGHRTFGKLGGRQRAAGFPARTGTAGLWPRPPHCEIVVPNRLTAAIGSATAPAAGRRQSAVAVPIRQIPGVRGWCDAAAWIWPIAGRSSLSIPQQIRFATADAIRAGCRWPAKPFAPDLTRRSCFAVACDTGRLAEESADLSVDCIDQGLAALFACAVGLQRLERLFRRHGRLQTTAGVAPAVPADTVTVPIAAAIERGGEIDRRSWLVGQPDCDPVPRQQATFRSGPGGPACSDAATAGHTIQWLAPARPSIR